ncbi:tyrosine-type recombinase/integrase [Novosphingobium sp. KACC 22771]|uniref:tyrosine-type recombinase/integrase n=1 Tax=Novosphingobium sp. KACC 22771 TaxID=3025670 RepID=UPI0023672EBE|nr:integrase arm-type DNA-binding domain-containing protein [Novosphingobium sp. KACC 22771]WDF75213.1 integrase arm-type DNA-binding domain-containing protein [Novosphingobium sp. KACC 22771]
MAKKITFSPAMIDALCEGSLADPMTPGLAIEVLKSGKKRWRYRRQVARQKVVATIFGGLFPAQSMAEAREWARELNTQTEAGIDPRAVQRAEKARNEMTVAKAHGLYMIAVHEGRSSRAKRINKPRTIKDKMDVYNHDIGPALGSRNIYEVTERDLINLVEAKGKTAKVRANRLAAELKVIFGWAASLRGLEVGLETDPSKRLGDLRFPEKARTRKLSHLELEWFLQALVEEEHDFQRGMLLCLLSAARISEMARARSDEIVNGVWIIPSARAKNSFEHKIALGPWGRSLMQTNHDWVFPALTIDGPRNNSVWYKCRDRVLTRMEKLAGHPIERFTPHDFRRTARSNTKRLKVDFETAEAMLNHVKKGMERTYDLYEMEDEKRNWFLKWEEEVASIAKRVGVAAALGVPDAQASIGYSFTVRVAKGAGGAPSYNFDAAKSRADGQSSRTNARITFPQMLGKGHRPD